MTSNIEYSGQAWPCEKTDEADTEEPDRAFTYHGGFFYGTFLKDKDLYEFQEPCLKWVHLTLPGPNMSGYRSRCGDLSGPFCNVCICYVCISCVCISYVCISIFLRCTLFL